MIPHLLNLHQVRFTQYSSRKWKADHGTVSSVSRHNCQLQQSFYCSNFKLIHTGSRHMQAFTVFWIFKQYLFNVSAKTYPQCYPSDMNIWNPEREYVQNSWNILLFWLALNDVIYIELISEKLRLWIFFPFNNFCFRIISLCRQGTCGGLFHCSGGCMYLTFSPMWQHNWRIDLIL